MVLSHVSPIRYRTSLTPTSVQTFCSTASPPTVAQYADESNLIAGPDDIPRKLEALDAPCDRLGRNRSEVLVSWLRSAVITRSMEQAWNEADARLSRIGGDQQTKDQLVQPVHVGDPDTVGERLESELALGVDGSTINFPANGHIEGRVPLLGDTVGRLFR